MIIGDTLKKEFQIAMLIVALVIGIFFAAYKTWFNSSQPAPEDALTMIEKTAIISDENALLSKKLLTNPDEITFADFRLVVLVATDSCNNLESKYKAIPKDKIDICLEAKRAQRHYDF